MKLLLNTLITLAALCAVSPSYAMDTAEDSAEYDDKQVLVSCRNCPKKLYLSNNKSKPLNNQTVYHQRHAASCQNPVLEFTETATTRFHKCDRCGWLMSAEDTTDQHRKHKHFNYPLAKEKSAIKRAEKRKEHELASHASKKQKKEFPCLSPGCGKTFTSKLGLENHTRNHNPENPYGCDKCTERFDSDLTLKLHKSRNHKKLVIKLAKTTAMPTSALASPSLPVPAALADPADGNEPRDNGISVPLSLTMPKETADMDSTKEKRGRGRPRIHFVGKFNCDFPGCGKPFKDQKLLDKHRKNHNSSNPFECPHCIERFATKEGMETHENIVHYPNTIKIFRCSTCNRLCTDSTRIKLHVRTHSGEKPFKCPCPGCTAAFNEEGSIKGHLRSEKHKEYLKKITNRNTIYALVEEQIKRIKEKEELLEKEGAYTVERVPKNTLPSSSSGAAPAPSSHDSSSYAQPAGEPAVMAESSSSATASIELPVPAPAAAADDYTAASTFSFSGKPDDEPELFPAFNPEAIQEEAEDHHDDLLSLTMPLAASDAEHYEYNPDNGMPFSLSLPMPPGEE